MRRAGTQPGELEEEEGRGEGQVIRGGEREGGKFFSKAEQEDRGNITLIIIIINAFRKYYYLSLLFVLSARLVKCTVLLSKG